MKFYPTLRKMRKKLEYVGGGLKYERDIKMTMWFTYQQCNTNL